MRRIFPVLLLALAGALAMAGSAAAAATAYCEPGQGTIWARPGMARSYDLVCSENIRGVRLAVPPSSGTVTDLRVAPEGDALYVGPEVQFTYQSAEDAPTSDSFVLEMSGTTGTTQMTIPVHIVPLSINTPPRCEDTWAATRTDGTAPATVQVYLTCTDDEHDNYTLHGASGPGTHLDDPTSVLGGQIWGGNGALWRYRTAATGGEEDTTYYATDALGLSSAPATIRVGIANAVDNPATCEAQTTDDGPLYSRPGTARRFTVLCTDPDAAGPAPGGLWVNGDFVDAARVTRDPAHGTITDFEMASGAGGAFGYTRRFFVTYQPDAGYTDTDSFGVTATTTGRGDGPENDIEIVPTDANHGGSCTLFGGLEGLTWGSTFSTLIRCSDVEDDPLTAVVTQQPLHGTATATPFTEPFPEQQDEWVDYTPDLGYIGDDGFTVEVSDGHGSTYSEPIPVTIIGPNPWTTPSPGDSTPPGDSPPPSSDSPLPANPPTAPVPPTSTPLAPSPASAPSSLTGEDLARGALKTPSVVLVRQLGELEIYAPARPLAVRGLQSALAVICETACQVSTSTSLPGIAAKSAVPKAKVFSCSAGCTRPLHLRLNRTQRSAVRHARHGTARFHLAIHTATGTSFQVVIPVRLRG